ncbi:MAG: DNA translocase FtsK [Alysiella sp.]|uniref:DNA translocase FtsK n=1 Tax=Alysiella sp. TaxID=1872483 RepID=UPI0026DC68A6|nr:DNA translocase FtsK [Alysiella sp.]MDO4433898.1 DNA translocase FtsK [Alysiella sp.]
MIYLLIVLLIAVLGILLHLQRQQEAAWQQELNQLSVPKHTSPPLSESNLTYQLIDEKEENHNQDNTMLPENTAFGLADDNKMTTDEVLTCETEDTPSHIEINNTTVQTLQNEEIDIEIDLNEALPFPHTEPKHRVVPLETITLAEATRVLRRPLSEALNDQHEADIIIDAAEKAEIITLNDPNLTRVRQRTFAETEMLLHTELPTTKLPEQQAETAPIQLLVHTDGDDHTHKSETGLSDAITQDVWQHIQHPPRQATIQTIDMAEIQETLSRQRSARQKLAAQNWQQQTENTNKSLPEIPADEVWANLSHNRLSVVRSRENVRTRQTWDTAGNTSKPTHHFTPQHNRPSTTLLPENSVAIAPTPIFPNTNSPAPEIVEPPQFPEHTAADAFAADFFHSNSKGIAYPTYKRITETPEPTNKTVSGSLKTPNHDEETHTLTEADFEAYYNTQNQETDEYHTHTDEHTSWAGTWFHDENDELPENTLPPLSLLLPPEHNPDAVQSPEALLENSIIIEEKLAEYRVKVKVLDSIAGPVITRYEVEPDVGVRGNSVLSLEKDLARSLGVAAIRVVETIPGKTCMGLELPNPKRQMIRLSEIFNSPEFENSPSKLTLALGQDITGAPVVTDLAKAPHLLVAGTTGSGKSVGVNSMILSMLYKATPEDVRMIMIDPKMLELSIYEGIPHLLAPVVTDMKLAANALNWCVNEMEKRYRLMSHVGVRNLAGYNEKIREAAQQGRKITNPFSFTPHDAEPLEKLPFIVVIVDEFADLMMVAGKQIEQQIARLAQKARAAGIHLILATQRPSVDVITGLIKANIPTRIAFQVSSKIDSRTVLDQMGAENLLGQGDMLFLPPGTGYPQRVHGAFVADSEVHQIVEYLKQFGEPEYIDEILSPEQAEFSFDGSGSNGERDPLFDQAVDVILRTQKATISSLQRHLRIGYNKAATIIDQLEAEGIVSAADHAGKRTILARGSEQ